MIRQVQKAKKIITEEGFFELARQFALLLMGKYGRWIPFAKTKWSAGLRSEMDFWDDYFRTKGLQWPESYLTRLDPLTPLQPRPTALLPQLAEVNILDVGAGPLTYLGKTCSDRHLHLTAVDPLADQYDRILKKYGVNPPVRTQKLSAEKLMKRFKPGNFDLVFARNCIDHSYDPENAILQMITVVKRDCYVLLEHFPNEGEKEAYAGLHQWNFSMSAAGDFLIASKTRTVNLTQKYSAICKIECEIIKEDGDTELLITRIRKKSSPTF